MENVAVLPVPGLGLRNDVLLSAARHDSALLNSGRFLETDFQIYKLINQYKRFSLHDSPVSVDSAQKRFA